MVIERKKRDIFRNMLRPGYKPLEDRNWPIKGVSDACHRYLVGSIVLRDKYFKYSIELVEFDDGLVIPDLPVSSEHPSHCHVSIRERNGKKTVYACIVLIRPKFSDDPKVRLWQYTERLTDFAHELLYVVQYPRIASKYDGHVTPHTLGRELSEPEKAVEMDLVCSFGTIAKFLHTVEAVDGTSISTWAELGEFRETKKGEKRFRTRWEIDHSIFPSVLETRMIEFFSCGFARPSEILKRCHTYCSTYHQEKCSKSSDLKDCPNCSNFWTFVEQLRREGKDDPGCDHEFAEYLCNREKNSLTMPGSNTDN